MTELFNALEAVELALEVERNGEAFYKEVARTTPNESVQCLFDYLAAEDKMHQAVFEEILRELGKNAGLERPSLALEPEYAQYLKALAESRSFKNVEEAAAKARSLSRNTDIIALASEHVKDELILFQELVDLTPEDLGRASVKRLVEEEKKHLEELKNLAIKLSSKRDKSSRD